MPSGTGIAPPRCHPPPDGGTLRHVNNSLPGPVSEGSVHGNGSRVSDICKYQLLCFATIIEVKVISGHQVKKVKQKKS